MIDLNYQLGKLVGSIIYEKYLPTLSTDMLQTSTIIEVDTDDLNTHNDFQKQMRNLMLSNSKELDKIHKEWLEFYKPMSRKYLPETIECKVEKIEPTNIDEFKKGLNDYLWDTDLSHYLAEDGFFLPNVEFSWCSTIILTRETL